MRYSLLSSLKVILIVAALVGGLLSGFFLLRPLVAGIALGYVNEPPTNVELYNSLYMSPPIIAISVLVGGMLGCSVAFVIEAGWNRLELSGFIPTPPEDASAAKIRLYLVASPASEPDRTDVLFEMRVPAAKLHTFYLGKSVRSLVCLKRDGSFLKLSRVRTSAYSQGDEKRSFDPISISVGKDKKVVYAFETTDDGTWYRPENSPTAFCRYPLTYPGLEDRSNALLTFSGMPSHMKRIFIDG
jgi:hypothetical protein